MTATPLVSILIVSHNAGPFLSLAVQSIVAQTYPAWEIVLVDNASDDGSITRVAGTPHLRVVAAPRNLGPSGGACLGFAACRGDYIARLDADDVALPERLARQVALLEARPDLLAVGSDVLCINRDGHPLHPRLALRGAFLRRHGSAWESACVHSTLLFRRSATTERFYNPSMGGSEDVEWIQWLARDGRLGLIPAPLVQFRIHRHSFTKVSTHYLALAGADIRLQLSRTAPETRLSLATRDFSFLRTDPRVALTPREQAQDYLRTALVEKNFLAAAYFSTTAGRWPCFPGLLLRAWIHGRPWRDVAGLLLVRTAWPFWKWLRLRLWQVGRIFSRTA